MIVWLLAACSASGQLGDAVCDREFECFGSGAYAVLPYETEAECRQWNVEAWDDEDCAFDGAVLDECADAWRALPCEDVVAGRAPPECDEVCG